MNHGFIRNNSKKKTNVAAANKSITVFISYKSADIAIAEKVNRFLLSKGYGVFFSRDSLPNLGRSEYTRAIDSALDNAQHLVVIADSAEKVCSQWVMYEWESFLNEKRSGRKRGNVIVLITENMSIEELPYALRQVEAIPLEEMDKLCYFLTGVETDFSALQEATSSETPSVSIKNSSGKKDFSRWRLLLFILTLFLVIGLVSLLIVFFSKQNNPVAPNPPNETQYAETLKEQAENTVTNPTPFLLSENLSPTLTIVLNDVNFSIGDKVEATWSTLGLDSYKYIIVKEGEIKLQCEVSTVLDNNKEKVIYYPDAAGRYKIAVYGYQIIEGESTPCVMGETSFSVAND